MSKKLSNYENKEKLGEGGFGKVYKVLNKEDGKYYAMKIISDKKCLKINLNILESINHDNIVKYYHSFTEKDNSFEQEEKLYIIMEYCEHGDLRKFIETHKKNKNLINQIIILNIILDICNGLKEIHSKNIIHRDLKPENIFIGKDYKIKIGDFGFSKQLVNSKDYVSTKKGSLNYIAPEMFKNSKYNNKVDLWSLGCIIYELCTLKYCFDFDEFGGVIGLSNSIINMKHNNIDLKYYSYELQKLIDSLLKKNYEERPNINEVYSILVKFKTNYLLSEIDYNIFNRDIKELKKVNIESKFIITKREIKESKQSNNEINDILKSEKNNNNKNILLKNKESELSKKNNYEMKGKIYDFLFKIKTSLTNIVFCFFSFFISFLHI